MDAVAVSISSGISVPDVRLSQALKMAFCFGFFQALMPAIGYLAGEQFGGVTFSLLEIGLIQTVATIGIGTKILIEHLIAGI